MAAAKSKARKKKKAPAGRSGAMRLLVVVVVGAILLVATPATVIVAVGLLPTFVAYLVDREPEGYAAVAVGGLNIAAVVPYLLMFWNGAHTLARTLEIVVNVQTLLIVYGAAALGWVLYFSMPSLANAYLRATSEARAKRMKNEQERLIAEWGTGLAEDDDTVDRTFLSRKPKGGAAGNVAAALGVRPPPSAGLSPSS